MLPYLTIGSFKLPMYGLCILIGATLAVLCAGHRAKKTSVSPEDVLYVIVYTALGAILGGKLMYVITSWDTVCANASYYFSSIEGFREFFSFGFVFYGGLILGLAAFIAYTVRHKLNLGDMITLIIPVVPLAHSIGRVGCFCAGCCYGIPMDPPWGVYFKSSLAPQGVALFPVQLLEAALNFLLFLFMYHYTKKPRKPGAVLGLYLVCYAVERFGLEYLRYDEIRGFLFGISTSQWISLILIPIGLLLIFIPFEKKVGLPSLAGPGAFTAKADETAEKSEENEGFSDMAEASNAESDCKTETTEDECAGTAKEAPEEKAAGENEPCDAMGDFEENEQKDDAPQA